jgi:ankyrin repeat protein
MADDFKEAQSAQKFYGDSVKLLMEGRDDNFFTLLNSYLAENPSINVQDVIQSYHSDGKNLLHIASSSGKLKPVARIVEMSSHPDRIVNAADNAGFTPLLNATIAGSVDTLKYLLKAGADVNAKNKDDASAVHFAAGDGCVEILEILKEAGADLNQPSHAGTPIAWASGKGKYDALR